MDLDGVETVNRVQVPLGHAEDLGFGCPIEGFVHDIRGEECGKNLGFPAWNLRIDEHQGDATTSMSGEFLSDGRVGVGEIALKGDDFELAELSNSGGDLDAGLFIELTIQAGVGGEIDQDGVAFGDSTGDGFWTPLLPLDFRTFAGFGKEVKEAKRGEE